MPADSVVLSDEEEEEEINLRTVQIEKPILQNIFRESNKSLCLTDIAS